MENTRSKLLVAPEGWADVLVRTVTVLVISFVTLTVKEWLETRELDIPACAIDSGCIAVGTFLFYAIVAIATGGTRRTSERLPVAAAR
jgi:hypothetical protein